MELISGNFQLFRPQHFITNFRSGQNAVGEKRSSTSDWVHVMLSTRELRKKQPILNHHCLRRQLMILE